MKVEVTPVTIPNTEVKLNFVDGTASNGGGRVDWCHQLYKLIFNVY